MNLFLSVAPPTSLSGVVIALLSSFLIALVLCYVTTYLISPLRGIPGPFLAGWTNLWRMYHVSQGKSQVVIHELHKKYGPVVRIGPNIVDLDLPRLIKTVYNTKGDYRKTEFYHGSSARSNGKIIYNLFSECEPEVHAKQKRPIAQYYSMTGVLPLEHYIDEIIGLLCQQMEEKFINASNVSATCDLGQWVSFYTWDVVGKTTFSQPIGYLEKGYVFDHTLSIAIKAIDYFALVSQIPILDHLLDKNPIYRIGPPSFGNITNISIQHLIDRLQGKDTAYHDPGKPDFLDKFIEAKEKFPNVVDDGQIISYLMINMIAGADTTAITINAALYFSLKNRQVWKRLQEEIPVHQSSSNSSTAITPFKEANDLPYLNAVVREAMRMHPIALNLERYVPKGGLTLPDGRFIPQGSIVGMNPYIIGRNTSVWGHDSEVFCPERWLRDETNESEEEYQERLHLMNSSDLTFGAGSRVCIGRNLALLQVYKVMATLVARYYIELAHPDRDWKTHNSLFVRQEGIDVKLSHWTQ